MVNHAEQLHGNRSASESARLQALLAAVQRYYARGLFGRVLVQMVAVMGLIEAIFLAERFSAVFDAGLEKNASLFDMALMLACNSTEIFDLALPIAVLMACYWVILQMREDRELLVLFAAGIGPYQLIALTMAIAIAGQLSSLTVSGVFDPVSHFAQRVILFDAEIHALKRGIKTGEFYFFPNHVAFSPDPGEENRDRGLLVPSEFYFLPSHVSVTRSGPPPHQAKSLFIYQEVKPGTARVITADQARLDGPNSIGTIVLRLGDFSSYTFAEARALDESDKTLLAQVRKLCPGCAKEEKEIPQISMQVRNMTQEMSIDELVPFPPRGTEVIERTFFEQLGAGRDLSPRHKEDMRLLGERFSRSLLCLLAPLMALAAVCLTSRMTNYLALPLVCMALMALNLTGDWLIRTLAPADPAGALILPTLYTAAIMVSLVVVIMRGQSALVRPQLARP
jgi:lipopolysaccharide export system permease protein